MSSLEVHRLNYLLSMGACVISEYSSDPVSDNSVSNASTVPHHDLPLP
jgi:hypothetical protein